MNPPSQHSRGRDRRRRPTLCAPLLSAILLVWSAGWAGAQTVDGRIVDATTEDPLPDATVEIVDSGSTRAVDVGEDGTFSTSASGPALLRIRRLGYLSAEVDAEPGDSLRVALEVSPLEMDQITVAATRTETRLEDAPGAVSVIGRPQLESRSLPRIDRAVALTPGVYNHRSMVLDDGHGSVYLRGLPGQNRTLVLVDGIPMNDGYNGGVRFGGFAAEDLERVEVVRGPTSSLYGGYAMGGVVSYVSRTPRSRSIRAEASLAPDVGSGDNTLSGQNSIYLSYGDRVGTLSILTSYRRHQTDGYAWDAVVRTPSDGPGEIPVSGFLPSRDRTGQSTYVVGDGGARGVEDDALTAKLSWDAGPDTRLSLTAMRVTQGYDHSAPSSYVTDADGHTVWSGSLTVGGQNPERVSLSTTNFLSSFGGKEHLFVAGRVETSLRDIEVRAVAGYSDYESWYSTYDGGATYEGGSGKVVRNPAPSAVADVQATARIGRRHTLTFGGTLKRDEADLVETNLTDWRDTGTTSTDRYRAGGTVTTAAGFVQDQIELGERVTAYLGLRYDRWRTHDGFADVVGEDGYPAAYENRTSSFLSPRISVTSRLWEGSRVKLSAARAFRGPTVFELYRTWTLSSGRVYHANPDLGPETMRALDLGMQQRFGGFTAGFTLFHNEIRDLIERRGLENGDAVFENIGGARTRGLELQAEQRLGPDTRVFANYTWTDAEVVDNPAAPETEGKTLTGIPEHMANAGFEYGADRWSLGMHARYVGKRYGLDDNSDVVTGVFGSYDPFLTVDARVGYRWRSVELGASVDNLLDRRYFDYYLAPGRTLRLEAGLDLDLQ